MNTLRNAGKVKRFHTVETIGQQTVAEHSFNVCLILLFITNGTASSELLKAALYHDLPELITGDIPATAKWKSEALSQALTEVEQRFEKDFNLSVEISDSEKLLLKWADMYELVQYCFDRGRDYRKKSEFLLRSHHHPDSCALRRCMSCRWYYPKMTKGRSHKALKSR